MDWLNTPFSIPGLPQDLTAAQIMAEPLFWTVVYAIAAVIALLIVWAVIKAFSRRAYQTGLAFRRVVLLVSVPKESQEKGEAGLQEKSLQDIQESIGVMEAVFTAIGGLNPEKGMKAGVLGREDSVSFEIIADHGLVTFYIATPPRLQDYVVQQLQAQYPHALVEEVADYNCFVPRGTVVGSSLKFRQAPFFPIKTFRKLESDPLNSLTNALAKVSKEDGAGIQVVIRSADSSWRRPALSIASAMQQGKSYKQVMAERSTARCSRRPRKRTANRRRSTGCRRWRTRW